MSNVLMKCGHSANAVQNMPDGTTRPVCIICMCSEIADNKPDLTGRKAKCSYFGQPVSRNNETHYPKLMTKNSAGKDCCGSLVASNYDLPFFKHNPEKPYDEFYCGCESWD